MDTQDEREPSSQHSPTRHPVPGLHGERVVELMPGFPIIRLDEASLDGLTRLMSLEDDIFGDEASGEWHDEPATIGPELHGEVATPSR